VDEGRQREHGGKTQTRENGNNEKKPE